MRNFDTYPFCIYRLYNFPINNKNNKNMKNKDKDKSPIQNMYGIYDIVAGKFFPPFLSDNEKTAVRSFADLVNKKDSPFYANPEDFELSLLGDFDPTDGQIDLEQPRKFVVRASDLVKSTDNYSTVSDAAAAV